MGNSLMEIRRGSSEEQEEPATGANQKGGTEGGESMERAPRRIGK